MNSSYRTFAHFNSGILLFTIALSEGITILIGSIASIPCTRDYGVAIMEIQIDALCPHKATGSSSGKSL